MGSLFTDKMLLNFAMIFQSPRLKSNQSEKKDKQ